VSGLEMEDGRRPDGDLIQRRGQGAGSPIAPGDLATPPVDAETFRLLLDSALVCVFWHATDKRYKYVSSASQTLFGHAPDEFLADPGLMLRLIHPDDRARYEAHLDMNASDPAEMELRVIRRDGEVRWISHYCARFMAADGSVLGRRGSNRDITRQKQSEEQLRTSEERLQLALEATAAGVWDWDVSSGLAYLSPGYFAISGYAPGSITPDFEFFKRTVHPDDLPLVLETMAAHRRGETPEGNFDFRLVTANGEIKWMTAKGRVIARSADGAPLRMIGTLLDISDRKRMETELRRSEEQFRLSFENSRDAQLTLAPPLWQFTNANPATLRLFGASSMGEFTALGPWDVSPERQPDGRLSSEAGREMIAIALREGAHFFEWTHRRLDGAPFAADVMMTRLASDGDMLIQATVRDISGRKAAEDELRKRAEELARFNRAMIGRELEMLEMKKQINALSRELGREAPFPLAFLAGDAAR